MIIADEQDVLLKEKYGSSYKERLYVKPAAQKNVIVLDEPKYRNIIQWFARIFLPQGYPDSVSKDYIAYQVWDTAQAFCSTITGILATQEVLRGVGVGDVNATPLAATITWVIKDGCGHMGRILFAFSHGTYLDAYSKKWRLYADTLNDAAMCIEIALPLFKNYTMFALCVSTVMKSIVGVAGGATRVAMTQHHAVRGNLADVSAKDSAQETAVNLIASFTALGIISMLGNSMVVFVLLLILHIVFNYFAVRAVCLRTLNEPRFLQIIDMYLRKEVIGAPCAINRQEPIIFYQLGSNLLDLKLSGFKIKLGVSFREIVNMIPHSAQLSALKEVYQERQYIVYPNVNNRIMYVCLNDSATNDDILCSYFHAVLLSIITCAINDKNLPMFDITSNPRPFALVCQTLQSADWSRQTNKAASPGTGFQYQPSTEVLKYVDNIVQKEWRRIKVGLAHTGWDLSKHLIMVDEWRMSAAKNNATPLYSEEVDTLLDVKKRKSFQTNLTDETFDTDKDGCTIDPFECLPDNYVERANLLQTQVKKAINVKFDSTDNKSALNAKVTFPNDKCNISVTSAAVSD